MIVVAFLAFQTLDVITTHIGFSLSHPELNRLMASIVGNQGELAAYAIKGVAIAALLAILMLLRSRRPHVWQAFHVGTWLTAVGVAANLYQILG